MAIVINGSGTVTGISVGGLPDGIVDAGTLATNSVDSAELVDGSIDTAHIAADQITAAILPTGSVLQVVSTGTIATTSTTSSTFVDSTLTQAITPSSTSSKIRVDVCFVCTIRGSNSELRGGIKILRGSTVIWNSVGSSETWQVRNSPSELNMVIPAIILDSPSSTSAVTYKIQYASNAGSGTAGTFTLYDNTYGTAMILTEVAG